MGTVFDESGAPVPGAQVRVTGNAVPMTTTTDANGAYVFVGVPAGEFTVFAASSDGSKTGYAGATLPAGLALNVDVVIAGSPNFSLSATPSSQTVLAGGSTSYAVSILALNGFSDNVALSVTGLPTGATASFTSSPIVGSPSSTLNVTTAGSTPKGSYSLTITGQSGSITHTTSVGLEVQSPLAISASASPAPNGAGWNNTDVSVTFQCSGGVAPVQCPPAQLISAEGANQNVSGTAIDAQGNSATTSTKVSIDKTEPTISPSATPVPNARGWNNQDVTVSFTCSDAGSGIQACPPPTTLTAEGANQVIHGSTLDKAGNSNTTMASVSIDKTPPIINISSPATGIVVSNAQFSITGTVSDAFSGVSTVSCGGTPAVLSTDSFVCDVTLSVGSNAVAVQATDNAGNSSSASLLVTFVVPPQIIIASPTSLTMFNANPITITGSIDDPQASVSANGIGGSVSGSNFTITGVSLREGKNLLTVTGVNAGGGAGSATVTVFLDTTPPQVHIDSPADGAIVTSQQITVMGNVNDVVSGTVNGDQVSVTVNGINATVSNRSFAAQNVTLVPGQNSLTAIATDRAGNVSQHQIGVTFRDPAAGQHLVIVSGNNQTGVIGTLLPQPLTVQALDGLDQPIADRALTFHVSRSDGTITAFPQTGRDLTLQTGLDGQASVQFKLGSRNGGGINQVSVTAPGFVGETVFTASSIVGAPVQIRPVSGEIQKGAVGSPLPEPLVVIVMDAAGNPVSQVPVTFKVETGGGSLEGATSVGKTTDNDGKAFAILTLAQQAGSSNNVVSASIDGVNDQVVSFVSSSVVTGPQSATRVSGIVLDNAEQPIANVTATIKGSNLPAVTTDAQGRFTISGAPVGDIVLYINGTTSTRPESFPTLSFQMVTLPGIDNQLSGPIYLPQIDLDNSQEVGGDQDVILTMKGVPGVAYKVFAHSVTFPDGSTTGRLTLSQVHADRVPMIPPNGSGPTLAATLQPAGVSFDPPIQMVMPNTDGLPPGTVTEVFGYRHDLEQFVSEGTARVSNDGSVIVTDPGFGLRVAGWHFFSGSAPSTCASGCGPCQKCIFGSCHANPLARGTACDDGDDCTVNDKCTFTGSCEGDKVTVDKVQGACIVTKGASAAYTAVSTGPDRLKWTAGGGATPKQGKGASFTTQFNKTGMSAITAECGNTNNAINVNIVDSCSPGAAVIPTNPSHIDLGHLAFPPGIPGVTYYHDGPGKDVLPGDIQQNMCYDGSNWILNIQSASKAIDSERRLLSNWTQITVGTNTTADLYCSQIADLLKIHQHIFDNSASYFDLQIVKDHEDRHIGQLQDMWSNEWANLQKNLNQLTVSNADACDANAAQQKINKDFTAVVKLSQTNIAKLIAAKLPQLEADAIAAEDPQITKLTNQICTYAQSQHFPACAACQ
jgi:hypothetical protein